MEKNISLPPSLSFLNSTNILSWKFSNSIKSLFDSFILNPYFLTSSSHERLSPPAIIYSLSFYFFIHIYFSLLYTHFHVCIYNNLTNTHHHTPSSSSSSSSSSTQLRKTEIHIYNKNKTNQESKKKMGRAPCCDKANVKKGPWSPEEDAKLKDYIENSGTGGNWIALPQKIGIYSNLLFL